MLAVAACAGPQTTSIPPLPPLPATSAAWLPDAPIVDPGTAERLGLDDLLVYADAWAPAIASARARVAIADADDVAARVRMPANPELTVQVGGRHAQAGVGPEFGVELAQQVELGGVRTLRMDAARAERETASARVDVARWAVHVEVHRLYVDVLLAAERRALASQFVAFSTSLREIAARQVDAGEVSPLVLLVADADLASAREVLLQADTLERALRVRLAGVVGWPGALPPVEGQLPPITRAPDVDTLLATMAAQHPALRARELAARASAAHLLTAEREARIDPTFGVGYDREAAPGPERDADVWRVFVTVPLPTWRTSQGERAQAAAQVLVDGTERDEVAAALSADLAEAVLALDAAAERVDLYATAIVPSLQQNLGQLQRAWELGEADVHQVSQTRERLLDATRNHLDARVAWYETAATLEGLVGAELWSSPEVP